MGVYDTISDSSRDGQVKLWGNKMRTYAIGDSVPSFLYGKYSIAMREGGWVNIRGRRILSWTTEPLFERRFNKWGGEWGGNTEGYLFQEDVDAQNA